MEEGKKKVKVPRRPNRPLLVLWSLVLVVSTALAVVLAPHADILNILLSKGDVTSEAAVQASQATADITEEVESEAVILLKNKDAALPLGGNAKVNVFGSTAGNNFSYGGTGSGAGDESKNVTFYQGLENAGIQANPELKDFYDKNAKSAQKTTTGMVGTDWNLYELPQSDYDQSLIDNAKSYSDTAVVVLTRKGGEGYDLPIDMADYEGSEAGRSYLQLTPQRGGAPRHGGEELQPRRRGAQQPEPDGARPHERRRRRRRALGRHPRRHRLQRHRQGPHR